ncbi:uncharacterized protein [Chironomus tepperi]|uniref:uncharacterized protein n=1 Tax=Chironomus tepperi TaxID=113505 RepID=UPI00391F04C9
MFRFNLIKYQIRYLSSEARLLKGTLTLRFHDYLTNNHGQEEQQKSKIIEDIEKISDRGRGKTEKIKIMDRSYMKSLRNQLRHEDMIECLEYLVKIYPNQILNLRFFDEALKILLENDKICRNEFVKLCYFIGFLKKFQPGPKYLEYLIDKYLDDKLGSNELNRMDFAIFCISTYKSSVRISNKKFHDRLIAEVLATDDNDTYLLVAFVKSLKQNEIVSSQVIYKLRELIEAFEFDYASLVHILPYIADNSIKDDSLIQLICTKCINTFDDNVRAKDVQKFLHSCAMLNLKMNKADLEKLENVIISRTSSDEYKTHFDHFVNAALSLWMLNHQSNKLIKILFEDSRFYKTGLENRLKLDSRKLLLQTCVEIEKPKWINQSNSSSFLETRTSPGYLIKSSLERAMNTVLADKNGIFVQQIKNLNLAGILVTENDEKIHYEILDRNTCLSDRKTPNGIFQLKLRLLRKKKCNVKVISIFK